VVTIPVFDPTGAACDPALPTLSLALDPDVAELELRRLPALAAARRLSSIRVVRHKPGRRCLVAYALGGFGTVYGKTQRRRYGKSGHRLLAALRAAGFDGARDGIAVPEPLGVVGSFRMWLQREARGVGAGDLHDDPAGQRLAPRIAEAAHKLHRAGVEPDRRHGVADELRILEECLGLVAAAQPRLAPRIERLLAACGRAAGRLPAARHCGIHRDFYPDQVLVDGDRLTIVDFDLFCLGDPALDVGNYVGHVTEHALRTRGDAEAFAPFEHELEERFGELAGPAARERVPTWTALTLARHVYLSTRFDDRCPMTEPLLELAEERLRKVAA